MPKSCVSYLGRVMRKPVVKSVADQGLCFSYIDSTIPLPLKSENVKSLSIFCGCTARFVYDLVGNLENRFSHDAAHF